LVKIEPRKRREGSSREAILAGASRLFAERGHDGASLRDVAAAAGVRLSLIDYYFGTKEALFSAALASKAPEIAEALRVSLDRKQALSTEGPLDLADIVEAYVEPHWRNAAVGDAWRDDVRMAFAIISRPDRLQLADPYLKVMRGATDRYESALVALYPNLSAEDIAAAMRLINLSLTGLILHVTSMRLPSATVEHRFRSLLRFCVGGVEEIAAAAQAPQRR
jgi:AcrR family transcriptional regulator